MTIRHKRSNDRTYQYPVTHVTISDEVADRLRQVARAEGRKLQWLADLAVREWLDRHAEKHEDGQ